MAEAAAEVAPQPGHAGRDPPSPELLAKVDALPPANDLPGVSQARSRAADPHFTLRRLLRPIAVAMFIGLVLDGLDAIASVAMPALVRGGVDHGVLAKQFHAIIVVSLIGLAIVGADWVINVIQTNVVGRNGERMLYTLRVKIFSHLQRLGLDFYERELSGRIMTRMTTDVDALSTFLQTGLITMVNSVLTFVGVLIALLVINLRLGLILFTIIPVLVAATLMFRAKSSKAYNDAREKVSVVNADLQENVAGLRTAQAYRREGRNSGHFAELSDAYRRSRLRAQRYIALYFPFVQLLSTVAGALILFVAAGEVHNNTLTAGGLIAYLLYIDLLLPGTAALPGLRRLPAGRRRPAPDQGPAATADQHAAGRASPARGTPTRPDRVPRRAVQVRGQPHDALSGVNLVRGRRARGPGWPDRRGQVHHGEAGRAVLRRHLGQRPGGRHGHP